MRVCECCERERQPDEAEFVVTREGDSFCPECNASLMAELQRMIAKLPKRISLCPQCAPEFYYPLNDGEDPICPTLGCGLDMIVYEPASDRVRLEADLAALREAAQAVVEFRDDFVAAVQSGGIADVLVREQEAWDALRAVLASADSESRAGGA